MDPFNWMVMEILAHHAARERLDAQPPMLDLPEAQERGAVKRALASTLVRLGLRLDPAAGEGLGAADLTLAGSEGRR